MNRRIAALVAAGLLAVGIVAGADGRNICDRVTGVCHLPSPSVTPDPSIYPAWVETTFHGEPQRVILVGPSESPRVEAAQPAPGLTPPPTDTR